MSIVKGNIYFSIDYYRLLLLLFLLIINDNNFRMAYLSHLDIRGIDCFKDDTLLAVKAPYGSTLEVPDPDEGMPSGERRYEIQLNSRSGPIDVFLIQDIPSSNSNCSSIHNHNHGHGHNSGMIETGNTINNNSNNSNNINSNNNLHNNNHSTGPGDMTGFGHVKEEGCCTHLKHFELPSDPYSFELRPGESLGDLYAGLSDVFGNIFTTTSNNSNHDNNLPASTG